MLGCVVVILALARSRSARHLIGAGGVGEGVDQRSAIGVQFHIMAEHQFAGFGYTSIEGGKLRLCFGGEACKDLAILVACGMEVHVTAPPSGGCRQSPRRPHAAHPGVWRYRPGPLGPGPW